MYDPAADAWTPMNPNGAPTQTTINRGAWTGPSS
jgi:hypothetical protein